MTFKFSDRTAAGIAAVEAALREGFTTKAAKKDATDRLNRAWGEIEDATRDAIRNASPRPWIAEGRQPTEAEWAASVAFSYAPGRDLPMYLNQVRGPHSETVAQFLGHAADVELIRLGALYGAVKAADVKPVETKAAKARKAAAEVLKAGSQNVIAAAVAPLKADAIARAEKEAIAIVERAQVELANGGNDLEAVAPRGDYRYDSDAKRERKNARRALFEALTVARANVWSVADRSKLVDFCPPKAARFIDNAKADAAAQYDAFVAKLALKVGEGATAATLQGNHVWGRSILTVEKPAGSERWQTQMIVNISKLGKLFNQWPTRKLA